MKTQLPFTSEKPIFMKMAEVANFPQMSVEQQQIYMRSLNHYRTVLATKDYDLNRGISIGREEGRAEGRIEGREEGLAEGRIEGRTQERFAIAIQLLSMGMSKEQVSKATGLSMEELQKP